MAKMGKVVSFCATAAIIASSVVYGPSLIAHHELNTQATEAELISYESFQGELNDIVNDYNVNFNNGELLEIIASKVGQPVTVEKLRNVKTLSIDVGPLKNKDLSDLKYLINLENLALNDGVIDCSILKYNQRLSRLDFLQCNVNNMLELPNSIDDIGLKNCKITDGIVSLPYGTVCAVLNNSVCNKIVVKNPAALENFSFSGYGFLDMDDLSECENLKNLTLTQCPNVSNGSVINSFRNLKQLNVDEFCCVWGNQKIPNLDRRYYSLMNKLDKIANGISEDDYTEEERIEHITLFVLSKIEYDYASLSSNKLLTAYNTEPLSYAVDNSRGVCVGYATLFTALANRLGLDSYQPDSINHTWNMVKKATDSEYKAYDMTLLDNPYVTTGTFKESIIDRDHKTSNYINSGRADELLFYNFDCRDANNADYSYNTAVEKMEVPPFDGDIGFINVDAPSRQKENDMLRAKILGMELTVVVLIYALKEMFTNALKNKSDNNAKKKTRKPVTRKC